MIIFQIFIYFANNKYGGAPKITNMRYGTNASWWQNLQVAPPGDQNLQTMGHHIVATDSVEQR